MDLYDLVGAVLLSCLIGSIAFYLILIFGVVSYHHFREMLWDDRES